MSTFAEKVALLRENGLKVKEIAEKLGISRQFLQELVSGKAHVPVNKRQAIDNLLAEVVGESTKNVNQCQVENDGCPKLAVVKDELADIKARLASIEQLLIRYLSSK